MNVSEIMTRDVCTVHPDDSLYEVAQLMKDRDTGAILVAENDGLVGMVTDRDIVIRGLADGLDVDAPVREVMTRAIKYCFEDEDIRHVAHNMADIQVRRLPVMSRDKRLVGVVSLGDIWKTKDQEAVTEVAQGVAEDG